MYKQPSCLPQRSVGEWSVEMHEPQPYRNPFTDVRVDGIFSGPSGKTHTVPAFYDGDNTWRVRFSPGEAGSWRYRIVASPANALLAQEGAFEVESASAQGFLCATPGKAWGFHFESGAPAFLLADTTYNLFGAAHCGLDVRSFMERRKRQGFDFLRVRLSVSAFHPPEGYNSWQTRSTWPWGGSEQIPEMNRFNLEWFRTVDTVMEWAEALGLGLEMIMEAWGFEFPYNNRNIFTAEWELLWMRYLIARYDAFTSVYFWTLMNEYEYYPKGIFAYDTAADHWAIRIGRWVKQVAPHGHIVAVHNGPRKPPFAERFASDLEAIDCILFQEWGEIDAENGWLATGIDKAIRESLQGWPGVAMLVEYAYERNTELPLAFPPFRHCDANHTRRGAWRGACSGLCVGNGFENTWAPEQVLDTDQPGVFDLARMKRFFTELVPFASLKPSPDLIVAQTNLTGHAPLALASSDQQTFAVYLPAGGTVGLTASPEALTGVSWYDPRTGTVTEASFVRRDGNMAYFTAPQLVDGSNHQHDWVLFHST